MDKLLGSVRGYIIRCRDGRKITLVRYDMTNVDELVEAIRKAIQSEPHSPS
ncbi:MAG: hypothetical protein RMI91_14590 [Gemmatales bacterium]|nr:hypothetical protein [Gemmatales bacterium]MCS7168616.1 hypothetical protein [Gemmatales bacterium]MDW7995873.1 hypothetical protein [Gemmatales bacterium]MDW8221531.1 hypothetical protein [Gemmatales bacterium]